MKAIVLAGGIGSRLHPLSTEENPKQFLSLFNEKSLLTNTIERIKPVSDAIYVNTRERWIPHIQKTKLPASIEFIVEPYSRNTGPAIAYCITKFSDDAIVGFFPSDHYIATNEEFARSIGAAVALVKKNDTAVLFGIEPTEPCTEYGYIHHNDETVIAFKEKPQKDVAEHYLETGNYLWNSGMLFFRVGKMKALFRKYAAKIADWLEHDCTDATFAKLEKISIDYAVMEKASEDELQVVPCSFTWSDLGTFTAIEKIIGRNKIEQMLKNTTAIT